MMTEEERRSKMQEIVNAYHRVFEGRDGELVLGDLAAAFGVNHPAFLQVGTRPGRIKYDDTYGKIRDGQRSVYLHIQERLRTPVRSVGDFREPPKKVHTGLSEQTV